MMIGLVYVMGDFVFLIDLDLEEDLVFLELFYEKLILMGVDVVFGCYVWWFGGWLRNFGLKIYYWVFVLLCDFCFMKIFLLCG